jgi:hypothetical protein
VRKSLVFLVLGVAAVGVCALVVLLGVTWGPAEPTDEIGASGQEEAHDGLTIRYPLDGTRRMGLKPGEASGGKWCTSAFPG